MYIVYVPVLKTVFLYLITYARSDPVWVYSLFLPLVNILIETYLTYIIHVNTMGSHIVHTSKVLVLSKAGLKVAA
jgi:hypothetical protein